MRDFANLKPNRGKNQSILIESAFERRHEFSGDDLFTLSDATFLETLLNEF